MTKIMRYLFGVEEAQVITTRKFDGEHWYTAVDICNLLGIENHSQAVHRQRETDNLTLEDSEWRKESVFNGTSKRKMLMVNDSGALKLIFQGTSAVACDIQERARKTSIDLIPASWPLGLLGME
ncbi:Bro-N domain-containing protein [Geomonas sp. RF6]|uniref:BRO family protein n=1 Tax=Geomonas sp. RF6 TaxID=2897342 RepID=UPI001E29D4D0|nr:Bro-N domain-containing protein [Geomonas sp. RF6]UFS71772.1 Bro-N domain-containing protein [Geomonas sp. RF6]